MLLNDGKASLILEVTKPDWIEVYYNQTLVKKWQLNSLKERVDFANRNC